MDQLFSLSYYLHLLFVHKFPQQEKSGWQMSIQYYIQWLRGSKCLLAEVGGSFYVIGNVKEVNVKHNMQQHSHDVEL